MPVSSCSSQSTSFEEAIFPKCDSLFDYFVAIRTEGEKVVSQCFQQELSRSSAPRVAKEDFKEIMCVLSL